MKLPPVILSLPIYVILLLAVPGQAAQTEISAEVGSGKDQSSAITDVNLLPSRQVKNPSPITPSVNKKPEQNAPSQDIENITVEDISDRTYLLRLVGMIKEAKESIYISMYISNPKPGEKHPVGWLFQELLLAASRGVEVKLWLNSSFSQETILERKQFEPFWNDLKEKNIQVKWVTPERKLHDKLIVIDRQYVIEGSMNWTYTAIMKNYESSTLIRSKKLAEKKIERLEGLILERPEELDEFQTTFVEIPSILFTNEAIFPEMVKKNDEAAWDMYFYLSGLRKVLGNGPWDLSMQDILIGVAKPGADEKKIKKTIPKTLSRLEKDYHLLQFDRNRQNIYHITLLEPVSGNSKNKSSSVVLGSRNIDKTVRIPLAFYEYDYRKKWSLPAQFAYGISLLMESESSTKPYWMSPVFSLSDRFHIDEGILRSGFTELKRDNVIEFIFPKKSLKGSIRARLLVSYKNNPLLSEEEKETELLKIRNLYVSISQDDWKRARYYADIYDDPYDPKLARQFLELIRNYPEHTLDPVVKRVAQFSPDNSLRNPDYVKTILEKK